MTSRAWLRPLVLTVTLIAWLVLGGAIGGPMNGRLAEVQENDQAAYLPRSAESTLAGVQRDQFTDESNLAAVLALDGLESSEQVANLGSFVQHALTLPLGEGDPRTLADVVVGEPVIVPSEDGQAALGVLEIPFDVAFESEGESLMAGTIASVLREAWAESGYPGELYVTGPIGIFADSLEAFSGIDGILLLAALSMVLIILVIVYRSPVLPLMVLSTTMFALGLLALIVYTLADSGVVTLNGQSQGIMSILVVGATADYALLLIARYREELRRHASPYDAMRRAWRRSLEPIVASALTVILGLLTLLLSDLASNKSLGPVAALGIVAALLASLTLLPALLLIGGARARWVFWPKRPAFDPAEAAEADTLEAVERHAGVWGRVSRGVSAHPRRTWVAAFLGLAVLAAFLPTFRAEGVGDDDTFMGEPESIAGLRVLEDHFAAGQTDPVQVVASADALDEVLAALDGVEGVAFAYPLTPAIVQGAPPGTVVEPPLVVDGRVAVDAITDVSSSTQESKTLVREIREAVHAADPTALVGGSAAVSLDINLTTDRDLRVIIPTVLLVILLVLMALLRAVVAPLVIVGANVLSFAATIGLSALVFNHILGFPGSDSAVPLFAFVFLVALGIDYSIFLMSRAREEALKHGTREGVRRALAVTGGVITSAGIVLAATFGSLAVLPILFLVQMAFIVSVGVLIDTFVVRTLLVPGLIDDLGRRSWWPLQRSIAD